MATWDANHCRYGFHTHVEQRISAVSLNDKLDLVMLGAPFELPRERWKTITKVHAIIAKEWVNGGCVSRFYRFEFLGKPPLKVEARHVIASLERIGQDRELPKEIAGCSTAYLILGNVWHENLQQFGNAIFHGLSQGGFYTTKQMGDDKARELTTNYIESLFGETPESSLHFFGLDIGFSLISATDTD